MANELYIHTLRQLRDGCKAEHMDTETAALDAAIQALSCGGDCISRKAARDALDEWESQLDWNVWCYDHKDEAEKYNILAPTAVIDALPSVQPDLQPTCNQLATDCISRQQAIKEAESWVGLNGYEQHLQRDVVEWLKELPSAQPEVRTQMSSADCISRQAAINAAIDAINEWGGGWDAEREARDAINVLPSVQIDGDCVSRQAAIDAANRADYTGLAVEDVKKVTDEVVKELKKLPSVQPEPQWIPCSERLPEDLEEVNVTWVNHKPEPYYDFVKDKPFAASAVYYKGDWYWYSSVCTDLLAERGENEIDKIDDAIEITAWKPLPEPWRGEEQ